MRKRLAALAVAAVLTPAVAEAQSAPTPPPCTAPEFRQLDFWVGDWDLEFDQPGGAPGRAANRITRNEFGDCAIVEHFSQPGGGPNGSDYIGSSYSTYDPQIGKWRQMWVDNGGGVFVLTGGPVQGQPYVFELLATEPRGTGPAATELRMIWEQVTPDSLVWRWQGRKAGADWSDQWVLRYKRRK